MNETWLEFARKKKEEGRDQLFMIMNQPYQFEKGNVKVTISSPLQEDLINEFRTEIVQYLRLNLRNRSVTLTTNLIKPDSKKMIYTPQEKFNYLADKNPVLKELQERLGLDPDF